MSVPVPQPSATEEPVSRLLVPVLTLAVTVSTLSSRALAVFLPVLAADLGTSVSLLGQVPASMLFLAGVLALVAGPLADRYGFRRMLVFGLLTVVVSAIATGLSPNVPILLAVALVGAVARASLLPTAQAVVVTTFSDEDARRRAVSWVTTGISTAGIVGVPLMTAVAAATHWRYSFFLLGGLGIVAAVALLLTFKEGGPRVVGPLRVREILDSYEPLRRHRPTVLVMLATLAADTGLWATLTYASAFLAQRHGFSIDDIGWVWLSIGVLALAGTVIGGGKLGAAPLPLLFGTRLLAAVCVGTALMLPLPWQAVVGLFLVAAPTFGLGDLATTLVLTNVSPAGRATTLTLRSAAVCIGTAMGGVIGGAALAFGDYVMVGACSTAFLLVSAVLVWWSGAGSAKASSPTVS